MNLSTWLSHLAAFNTLRDIRTELIRKMLRLPMGYFEENGSGRLKTMLVDNVEGIEKTLAHMLPEMTGNLAGPVFLIIWMTTFVKKRSIFESRNRPRRRTFTNIIAI